MLGIQQQKLINLNKFILEDIIKLLTKSQLTCTGCGEMILQSCFPLEQTLLWDNDHAHKLSLDFAS